MNFLKTRQLYESRTDHGKNPRGRTKFVHEIRNLLGLCDKNGNDYKDKNGNRELRESKMSPESIDPREMGDALIGPGWKRYFDPHDPGSLRGVAARNQIIEAMYPEDHVALLEAAGVGVDVSAFADVNAWTSVVGGLIEVKILEAFNNPEFVGDKLMKTVPTKLNGQKIIGVSRLGDVGEMRKPGMPHRRAGVGERYVTTPETRENALAVDLFKETVFFDLTGQVMQHAGDVGEWLRYRKEIGQIDCVIGVTCQKASTAPQQETLVPFYYKGVQYDVYSTTAQNQTNNVAIGYINQVSNDLVDWTSFQTAFTKMVRFTDPETKTRVRVRPNKLIVNPARIATARLILDAIQAERRTAPSSTQATTADLHILRANTNVVREFLDEAIELIWSPLIEQRCTDTDGLALSQANTDIYWWLLQSDKAFWYMQNWPMTVTQAPSNSYDMLDRGIAATWFCNERGTPAVISPWHTFRNTN